MMRSIAVVEFYHPVYRSSQASGVRLLASGFRLQALIARLLPLAVSDRRPRESEAEEAPRGSAPRSTQT